MKEELPINPTVTDVLKAYKFLKDKVRHTPTEYSPKLSKIAGAPVYIKWENQQIRGSFKLRGALYKMNSLNDEEREKGVVTCSSGNHGQGVAIAANDLKIKTIVFVPNTCPEMKKEAIESLCGKWGRLEVCCGGYDFAEAYARKYAEEHQMTYVSSFEDPFVLAGQGTAGVEIFLDEPDIDFLVIPAGGGGLLNGIAIAAKALNPEVEIWGVQSDTSNPWVVSWNDGIVKQVEYGETLADGLSGGIPQSLLSLAKLRVAGIAEITEEDIKRAIAFAHNEHHQIIEGAGAVSLAAILSGKLNPQGRKTAVVISGGNIDSDKLNKILASY